MKIWCLEDLSSANPIPQNFSYFAVLTLNEPITYEENWLKSGLIAGTLWWDFKEAEGKCVSFGS